MIPQELSVNDVLKMLVRGGAYFSVAKNSYTIHFRIFRKKYVAGKNYMVYIKRDWADKKWILSGLIGNDPDNAGFGDPRTKKAFIFLLSLLSGEISGVTLYKHVKCKRCHRNIYDKESIQRGYGPRCWEVICERRSMPRYYAR